MKLIQFTLLSILLSTATAQINPQNVTIARDSFGVPHIFGKTDADAAYGLAWAHAEDDFKHIQHNLLAAQGKLGLVLGKEGVLFDFGLRFFGIDTLVDNNYEQQLSPDFRKVLEGYIQGINDYATAHPEEVLVESALPFRPQDIVKGSTLTLTLFAGGGLALKAAKENRVQFFNEPNDRGSNALAISPSKTEDGKTWLMVNSHQPIEGRFAWYEAHVASEEGWNIIGGLFPGGTSIFVGTTPNLGWAHTTNYHTFGDLYLLKHKGKSYKYGKEWKDFVYKKIPLKLKLGGLKLAITKKVPYTEQGPVFKTKHGWYAARFPGAMDIRATEQWYRMNKARHWNDFEAAVKMEGIPLFNIVYADVQGNIFWQSGCQVPDRDSTLNWDQPVDGTNPKYTWTKLVPYESKPSILNPECGYVFSCNQTPLFTSGEECNWKGNCFVGIQKFNYNRGERFDELLKAIPGKITWQDFMRIKFDKSYSRNGSYARNFSGIYTIDETKYPRIADAILHLKKWNWDGAADNRQAALALLMHNYLKKKLNGYFAFLMIKKEPIREDEAVEAITYARNFLLKTHGTIDLPLGNLQRHIRGNINIPASGLVEVSRASENKLVDKKRGIFRITGGDGYIQMNRYSKEGVEVNSINAYGASAHPESKHYNDQMEMFEKEQFKPMTFDKTYILKTAERVYHPGLTDMGTDKALTE
jgi:acyl-homoserine-lactone acylase